MLLVDNACGIALIKISLWLCHEPLDILSSYNGIHNENEQVNKCGFLALILTQALPAFGFVISFRRIERAIKIWDLFLNVIFQRLAQVVNS
jgi:hypothetical protein